MIEVFPKRVIPNLMAGSDLSLRTTMEAAVVEDGGFAPPTSCMSSVVLVFPLFQVRNSVDWLDYMA